jgi:hypothetical protein
MEAEAGRPTLQVDLTGVTFVDVAGKAQLEAMHRQGARFIADDCLTKAIVAEIAGELIGDDFSVVNDSGRPKGSKTG